MFQQFSDKEKLGQVIKFEVFVVEIFSPTIHFFYFTAVGSCVHFCYRVYTHKWALIFFFFFLSAWHLIAAFTLTVGLSRSHTVLVF